MTIEEQIAALLAKAEPLRYLPDHEQERQGLPGIVDQINALRHQQTLNAAVAEFAAASEQLAEAQAQASEAEFEHIQGELCAPKRRGRPPKNKEAE